MKKIHICLYMGTVEVINHNDVVQIIFLSDCICIQNCYFNFFYYRYSEFNRIEVDYYD